MLTHLLIQVCCLAVAFAPAPVFLVNPIIWGLMFLYGCVYCCGGGIAGLHHLFVVVLQTLYQNHNPRGRKSVSSEYAPKKFNYLPEVVSFLTGLAIVLIPDDIWYSDTDAFYIGILVFYAAIASD